MGRKTNTTSPGSPRQTEPSKVDADSIALFRLTSLSVHAKLLCGHRDSGFAVGTDVASGDSDVGSASDFTFHSIHAFSCIK
jgi:hypothetical protein